MKRAARLTCRGANLLRGGVFRQTLDMSAEQGGRLLEDGAGRLHVGVDRPARIDNEASQEHRLINRQFGRGRAGPTDAPARLAPDAHAQGGQPRRAADPAAAASLETIPPEAVMLMVPDIMRASGFSPFAVSIDR